MESQLFAVSPLYLAVGAVIALLVVQEYLRYGVPRRHRVYHSPRHHRPRRLN